MCDILTAYHGADRLGNSDPAAPEDGRTPEGRWSFALSLNLVHGSAALRVQQENPVEAGAHDDLVGGREAGGAGGQILAKRRPKGRAK